jgi:hypothetical protein
MRTDAARITHTRAAPPLLAERLAADFHQRIADIEVPVCLCGELPLSPLGADGGAGATGWGHWPRLMARPSPALTRRSSDLVRADPPDQRDRNRSQVDTSAAESPPGAAAHWYPTDAPSSSTPCWRCEQAFEPSVTPVELPAVFPLIHRHRNYDAGRLLRGSWGPPAATPRPDRH